MHLLFLYCNHGYIQKKLRCYNKSMNLNSKGELFMDGRKIDVHHHIIPDAYQPVINQWTHGKIEFPWKPEDSLKHMDSLGVQTAICSISLPALMPVANKDKTRARELARELNEYMAGLCKKYPGRFGAFAILPLPDIDGSLEEIKYALDVLEMDGIGLISNYGSEYLGNSVFEPIMAELNRHKTVVYVHPGESLIPKEIVSTEFIPVDYFQEFCFLTTRATTNLVLSGTTERYPDIRFIFSHMGGAIPYLGWRVDNCFKGLLNESQAPISLFPAKQQDIWKSLKRSPLEYFSEFYFDTAIATNETAFYGVNQMAPGHTLFGTDAFYATVEQGKMFVTELERCYPDSKDRYSIERGAAEKLFPRFCKY